MRCHNAGLGSSPFARHYLGNHCLFSLPRGTKMFQFSRFAPCISRVTVLQTAGLSHSEICGSMVICTYPQLIAAYHVLHRLHEPRHPPCALSYFLSITNLLQSAPLILSAVSHLWMKVNSHQKWFLKLEFLFLQFCLVSICQRSLCRLSFPNEKINTAYVENNGFEPLTPCLQSRCSSQLS